MITAGKGTIKFWDMQEIKLVFSLAYPRRSTFGEARGKIKFWDMQEKEVKSEEL